MPTNIGSNAVEINLTTVNFQPKIPNSIGILITAHVDHEVIKAISVPIPAPDCNKPAIKGSIKRELPGVRAPAIAPNNIPLNQDSRPTQFVRASLGNITWFIPIVINAKTNSGNTFTIISKAIFRPSVCLLF